MSETIEQTQKYIEKFYQTLVMQSLLPVDDNAIDDIAKQTIFAVISDPRGVLRCKNVLCPASEVMIHNTFIKCERKIGHRFKVIRLCNEFVDVDAHNSTSLNEKNVASVQKKLFTRATYLMNENEFSTTETEIERVRAKFGPLGNHPSVCFLVGMLWYKSGHSSDLDHAYHLFEYARNGLLLRPTCIVLQALCLFWAGKCGKFSLFDKAEPYPEVDKFILNYVLDQLVEALASANIADNSPSAVETLLMIDLHAAISLVYFYQNGNNESLIKSKEHFTIASSLHGVIPQSNSPSVVLLRAGRALNLDVAGMISWSQLKEINEAVENTWKGTSAASFRPSKELIINKLLWPALLSTPMSCWDSGAFIVELDDFWHLDENARKWTSINEVTKMWWYKPSVTAFVVDLLKICETCGSKTSQKCAACKKTYYCSQDCQKADWLVLHKMICEQICKL